MTMNRRTAALSVLAAASLALTACGSEAGSAEEPMESVAPVEQPSTEAFTPAPEPVPVETTPAPEETGPPKSPRGNLIAELGQTGTVSSYEGIEDAQFVVKDISPGVCTEEYQSPSENGQMVFVTMDITTTPELAASDAPYFSATGYDWTFISAEGTTFNGDLASIATYSCLPEASIIPGDIGPGESVTGIVVLDLPAATGTLVYEPSYGAGFEYEF